jgi:maleate isomerase
MQTPHNLKAHKIGMIVPSSNTTMETEIPALLHSQATHSGDRFTFHASRIRLQQVTQDALQKMNDQAEDAVDQLCDAEVDAIMYACLVAVMCGGKDCISEMDTRLTKRANLRDNLPKITTSAGALINALKALGAAHVSMITPYKKELTEVVASTLQASGIHVVQTCSLEVTDNVKVGRLDTSKLLSIAAELDLSTSDALIISACVQMPSLPVIAKAEQRFGLPVLSAATASAFDVLTSLGIQPNVKNAGELLCSNRTYPKTLVL